jgi:outer membrane protein assembly factor BamB
MKRILAFLIAFICIGNFAFSQATAQWRGDNRDGVYTEKNLLESWPENGPSLLWSIEDIGDGYGSPAITDDKVFVNGWVDSISHVFAFDLKGQLLWKTPNGQEFIGSGYSNKFAGSRSAPTIVKDLVYACSGIGRISCLNAGTGKEVWAVDVVNKYNGIMPYFGYSESILVDGDKLYFFPGGVENNIIALNRFSGEMIWTSKALSDSVSYCSPMIIKVADRKVLVNHTNYYIMGLDANNGELLWSHKQENVKYKQQCNTPVFDNGYLYYISDGNGAVKLEISPDGKSIKEIWRNNKVKNYFYGFVKIKDHLYSTDRAQKIKCIDLQTGDVPDTLKMTKGAMIANNEMLYCYSDNGEFSLIKLTGTKMETVGKLKIDKGTKEHFAHPVIKNGTLYIRHGKALMAYDIKGK